MYLANLVSRELKLRVRNEKPGLCTRVAMELVSPRSEAQSCGEFAVQWAVAGMTGVMVSLVRRSSSPYLCELATTPLAGIGTREMTLPARFMNASENHPNRDFFEYAPPLVGDGMPELPRIDFSLAAVPRGVSSSSIAR